MNRPPQYSTPISVRHHELSVLFSQDDEACQPSERLLDLSIAAITSARSVQLKEVNARMKVGPFYPDIWPGEHYKLLGGLLNTLKPKSVIEIGTFTGLSALTMKLFLPQNAKLTTFDILPWTHFQDTVLVSDDFRDGNLQQMVADLCDFSVVEKHRELLESADLFFIDAAKDGKMEKVFIDHFKKLNFKNKPIFVFDDIRVWNMLKIWREIDMPKMDLTSFGHWTGTGLVEWQNR